MMKSVLLKSLLVLIISIISVLSLWIFCPKPDLMDSLSYSQVVYDENGNLLRLTLSSDEKYRIRTTLKQIPHQLVDATLMQEDKLFYNHIGINPVSIFKAFWQTYIVRARKVGASTITMQLARLRYGISSKTPIGKIQQILKALQLERHYTKQQILEAYLNLAPYGHNIEGASAASEIYFHTPISKLNISQIMMLAVIPQNPIKRTPIFKNLDTLKHARDNLYKRWILFHPEDKKYSSMFHLPITSNKITEIPFLAPHFVNYILSKSAENNIKTTLDVGLQKLINNITQQYVARKKNIGIKNAAVLLVDTNDLSIKALIGSANFFDMSIGGQINGIEIARSPGSTLKPFIYALAIDQGIIHPATVLKDVPSSFNGYDPDNFDYDFLGPVSARDALVLSRNIPAIYLASKINPGLYQFLEKSNTVIPKPESFYGLSISLGGLAINAMKLAELYAMLANSGYWRPLNYYYQHNNATGKKLLSPEASFLVLDILKSNTSMFSKKNRDIAWKTGTSSGYRDAWTVGVFGHYVMTVWLGNFNNSSNQALVGRDMAAPLFFELEHALEKFADTYPYHSNNFTSLNLKKIEVCKASGMLKTKYCEDTTTTWFIPGKSPITTDTIFREIAINRKTGLRTCHVDKNTEFKIYEFWPSDLLQVFKKAGIQRRTPPLYEPNCTFTSNFGISTKILSPKSGIQYVIRINDSSSVNIPLRALTDASRASLYWFVDNAFVTKTSPQHTYLWHAKPGHHFIRVVDDEGYSDGIAINIIEEM